MSDSHPAGPDPLFVLGASGWSGAALCRRLAELGRIFVPVVRDAAKWSALGLPGERRVVDLTDWHSLGNTLADARVVVSCTHPRHVPAILASTSQEARFVLLGNARRATRRADGGIIGVRAGEAAFLSSGRSGVMLHPTTMYGSDGADGVQRLAALLRLAHFVPIPGGGRTLIQPIHQEDVTRCLMAAIDREWQGPRAFFIAGPEAMPSVAFVSAVAAAAGIRPPAVIPMPASLLHWLVRIASRFVTLPRIGMDDLTLLEEDQAFPIETMVEELGVTPMSLAEGLARCFPPGERRDA